MPFTLSVCKQGGNCTVYVAGESVHGASKFGSVFCIGAMTSSVYPGDGVSATVSACLCFPSTPHVSKEYTRKHSNVPTFQQQELHQNATCRRAELLRTYVRISQSNNLPNRNTNSAGVNFPLSVILTRFSPPKNQESFDGIVTMNV